MANAPDPTTRIDVIFSAAEIAARIKVLAGEVAARAPHDLLVVPILKGSFIFAGDLVRALHHADLTPEIDFLTLASYGDATFSSGEVRVTRDITSEIAGRDVLIVDDILETGRTLAHAKALVLDRGATSAMTCVLLDKPVPRAGEINADFKAFDCPEVFVVGYGMDLANRYRELPFVGNLITDN
ncbi:MAG: hypoxanthine phosphoribosyltransferase [Pseudomonadota bacterium]